MEQKKRAWVYCRIDAPEDTHGALKCQRQQLMDYADQMGFVAAGSSEDMGNGHSLERAGLQRITDAIRTDGIEVLLIHDISRISHDVCQMMNWLEQCQNAGVDVYSPLEGKLSFSLQKTVRDAMALTLHQEQ